MPATAKAPTVDAARAPRVSVVIPLYQTERYIERTIRSVLEQSFADFEIVVVDDGCSDRGPDIARSIADPRIRVITQKNRGLSGARNTGIQQARGEYIALLDADDLYEPGKLALHVAQFERDPAIGLSFSQSRMIDEDGEPIGVIQIPSQRDNFDAGYVFCRNPIGNGSAPVFRRAALDAIAYVDHTLDTPTGRTCWFDESFRQSEDIECWTRLAATTSWKFGYIDQPLTNYRVHIRGLSANVEAQHASWLRFRAKVAGYAPDLDRAFGNRAEAYQLRYLGRRAVRSGDAAQARQMILRALWLEPRILLEDPFRTTATVLAAVARSILPERGFQGIKRAALSLQAVWPALRF